jgi:hypothetical protein
LAGTNEARGGRRFTVLQALIVFAVAGLVAALAIPAFAAQAKTSVLRQNQVALALQVRTNVVLADDTTPAPDASPSTGASAADAIMSDLSAGQRSTADGRYLNPFSASSAFVCGSVPPAARAAARPAVWITDDAGYAYAAFKPSRLTSSRLAGSLVVATVERGGTTTIDIYYIDGHGRRSPNVETIATPAAAWQD